MPIQEDITAAQELVGFKGSIEQFWQHYLNLCMRICQASGIKVCYDEANQDHWKTVAEVGNSVTEQEGFCIISNRILSNDQTKFQLELKVEKEKQAMAQSHLHWLLNIPSKAEASRNQSFSKSGCRQLAMALEILSELEHETRFKLAIQKLTGLIKQASHSECCMLGWVKGHYVTLLASSETPHLESKTEHLQAVEASMEEALDLNDEIVWPEIDHSIRARQHRAQSQSDPNIKIISLPLRYHSQLIGVIQCTRHQEPFTQEEQWGLRLTLDRIAHLLVQLEKDSKPLPVRCWESGSKILQRFLGTEHTLFKLLIMSITLFLLIALCYPVTYRIESPCILRSQEQQWVSTPFPGFIKSVFVERGDRVKKGDILLELNKDALTLKLSSLQADFSQVQNEIRKQRGSAQAAQMKIAMAKSKKIEAEIALVKHQLERSTLKSPIDGVIVEGHHLERLGAAVQEGELLFRIAVLEDLYLELDFDQRRLHELKKDMTGEVALTSRPDLSFPFVIDSIEPAARITEQSIKFYGRGKLNGLNENWWRPGMSGLAKVNAGQKSLLVILTQDAIDWLRMELWW